MPNVINTHTRNDGKKPRYKSQGSCGDYAGNIWLAALYDDGANGTFIELWKITPQGQKTLVQTRPSQLGKMDAICCHRSGADIHTFPSDHDGDFKTDLQHEVFVGVATPYPEGVEDPDGAPGAFVGESEPGPQPGPGFTLEQLVDAVEGMFRSVLGISATGNLIGELRPHIMQKVEQLFKNGDQGGSFIVFSQLLNTSYAGALEAGREGDQAQGLEADTVSYPQLIDVSAQPSAVPELEGNTDKDFA